MEATNRIVRWIGSPISLIAHTAIFLGFLSTALFEVANPDKIMLVLTTAVSLEAIYLTIFLQMSMNRQSDALTEIAEDIDEIQEEVIDGEEDAPISP